MARDVRVHHSRDPAHARRYLAAGFVLHETNIQAGTLLQQLADLGVTLLLFTIGLKLDVRSLLRPVIWAGTTLHMLITVVVFGTSLYWLSLAGVAFLADIDLGIALLIGFAQAFAILPGISRSGATIVAGLAAVQIPGTRIEILPGLGPYGEAVVVNLGMPVSLIGVPGSPATVTGTGSGPTIDVGGGAQPVTVKGLTVEGDDGIRLGEEPGADGLGRQIPFRHPLAPVHEHQASRRHGRRRAWPRGGGSRPRRAG